MNHRSDDLEMDDMTKQKLNTNKVIEQIVKQMIQSAVRLSQSFPKVPNSAKVAS